MRLDRAHEQAFTRPLPQDDLARLHCGAAQLLIGCPAPPACRRERVFAQEMTWLAPHDRRPARPAGFSDAPIPLCQTIKLRFKPPLQRIEPWNRHGSE
jgi:hypothetical protein